MTGQCDAVQQLSCQPTDGQARCPVARQFLSGRMLFPPFPISGLKGTRGDGELRQIHSMRFLHANTQLVKKCENWNGDLGRPTGDLSRPNGDLSRTRNSQHFKPWLCPFALLHFFAVFGGSSGSLTPGCCGAKPFEPPKPSEKAKGQTGVA